MRKTICLAVGDILKVLAFSLVVLPAIVFVIYQIHPFQVHFSNIPCEFLEVTGKECFGCGGTRAVRSLLAFDLAASVRFNCFPVLCYLAALIYVVAILRQIGSRRLFQLGMSLCFVVMDAVLAQKLYGNFGNSFTLWLLLAVHVAAAIGLWGDRVIGAQWIYLAAATIDAVAVVASDDRILEEYVVGQAFMFNLGLCAVGLMLWYLAREE